MSYPLVCLGNPLLDLQVNVDSAYLAKYALNADDAILADEKHAPIYNEVVDMEGLKLVAGGAAQNTARGAQYILPADSVVYFGAVGDDKYAKMLRDANAQYGLRTEYQVVPEVGTGKCAALITGQRRSLVTDLGAANHFKAAHLDKHWGIVEQARFYYIGGYHLTVSPEAIGKIGKHAAEQGKVCALNFSAPFIPQFFKEPLAAALPFVDYVIANESEAAAYAEANGLGSLSVLEIAKKVAGLPKNGKPRTVVFTQGTQPTITATVVDGAVHTQEFPVHELAPEKVVDTNGAGDAFAAGFMAALVQGKPLKDAVDLGHWAAALSIQEIGPTFPFPKQTF